MSAPGATPGPWVMGQTAHTYEEALIGPDGSAIAMAAWDGGSGCHLRIENEANARLIAASPALYDALEDCTARLRVCARLSGNGKEFIDQMCAPFDAALAQARGKTS